MARKAKAAMKRHLNDLDDLTAERLGEEDDGDYVLPRPLTIGDTVYVTVLGTNGTVTALPDSKDNVEIQAGSMKMKVPLQSLRLRNSPKKTPRSAPPSRAPTADRLLLKPAWICAAKMPKKRFWIWICS